MTHLLEIIRAPYVLARVDRVACRVLIIEPIGQAAGIFVKGVIGVRVIGIVGDRIGRTTHVCAGIGHVEIEDPALDRQGGLRELVLAIFVAEALGI